MFNMAKAAEKDVSFWKNKKIVQELEKMINSLECENRYLKTSIECIEIKLKSAGICNDHSYREGTANVSVSAPPYNPKEHIDAIAEYLDIKLEYTPVSKLKAFKKEE